MVSAQARQTHGGSNRRQSGGAVTPVSFKYTSISTLAADCFFARNRSSSPSIDCMNLVMTLLANNLIPTRYSLLSRLQNWDDQDSWKDFFDTYWRLI
jgi:hypothetical protein